MRAIAFLVAAAVGAKLIITTAHGVAVTDYPNMQRCESAKAELIAKWTREAEANSPPNTKLLSLGSSAVCIPA